MNILRKQSTLIWTETYGQALRYRWATVEREYTDGRK